MEWIRRLFNGEPEHRNDVAYSKAVALTDDILLRMREPAKETEVARDITADIWLQSRNTPFMTTVYEATQEMTAPLKQASKP